MKKLIVVLTVTLVALFIVSYTSLDATITQLFSTQELKVISSEVPLDTDGDGFSDWFEENIAGYDPNIPNDRYIILFEYHPEEGLNTIADSSANFFKEGGVPESNIYLLKQEQAIRPNLQAAIKEVAQKADENDLVFLGIDTHGCTDWISSHPSYTEEWLEKKHRGELGPEDPPHPGISYADIDEWLDKIKAKAVIVRIMACYCETALPRLKDGPCPRIVFVHSAGEFISALGQDPDYAAKVDMKYGNNNGYVSLAEIGNWKNNEPRGWKDNEREEGKPGDGFWNGQSWLEKMGFSVMSDTSGIADQIYLTDYKIPG